MFKFFNTKTKKACPVCNNERTFSFSEELLGTEYIIQLEKVGEVGTTDLYKCPQCNTEYFKKNRMYTILSQKSKKLLFEFNQRELSLPQNLKEQLDIIGYTEGEDSNQLYPALVELHDGKQFDFARVLISKKPPLGYFYDIYETVIFIDDVKAIHKSEYALSQEIREESRQAWELRMGFAPTVLKTMDHKKVVINGFKLFIDSDNLKGSELMLANEDFDFDESAYIYATLTNKEILVVAKE